MERHLKKCRNRLRNLPWCWFLSTISYASNEAFNILHWCMSWVNVHLSKIDFFRSLNFWQVFFFSVSNYNRLQVVRLSVAIKPKTKCRAGTCSNSSRHCRLRILTFLHRSVSVANASTSQTAITIRYLREILLVVVLSIVKL
jgi:hypothetical protein